LRPRSVRRKLILGIALVHAALMGAFVIELVSDQREFLHRRAVDQARSLVETFAANSTSWLLANDVSGLQEVVRAVARYPDLSYAMALTQEGKVLAHSDASRIGMYLTDGASRSLLSANPVTTVLADSREIVDIATPVMAGTTQIGWVRVGLDQGQTMAALGAVTRHGAGYTATAVLIGTALAWLATHHLTRRLGTLVGVADRVAGGDYRTRSRIESQDEVGRLSVAFDRMLDKIVQEETRFRAVFDSTYQFIGLLSPDGTLLEANQAALAAGGLRAEEVIGKPFWETSWWSTSAHTQAQLRGAIGRAARGEFVRYETDIRGEGGRTIYIDFSLKPVRDETGSVVQIIPEGRDITERKLADQALAAERALLRTVIDVVPDCIVIKDTTGRYTMCNAAMVKRLKLEREEDVLGKSVVDFFPRELAELASADDRQVLGGTPILDREEPGSDEPGKPLWFLTVKIPLRDHAGRIVGIVGTSRDITERKRQEEALLRSHAELEERVASRTRELEHALQLVGQREEELSSIMQNVADGIVAIDESGVIHSFNGAAERIFGYRSVEVIGRNIRMLMPEPHRTAHDGYLAKYRDTGQARIIGTGREVEGLQKNGTRVPLELAINEYFVHGERHFTGILRDITERKAFMAEIERARDAAEHASRAKSAFLAVMSHEIRTPMNGVLGMAEVLQESALSSDQSEMAQTIRDSAAALLRIIDDILDFSKIEAGKVSLETRPISLWSIVEEVRSTLAATARSRGVGLTVWADPALPGCVHCDDTRLRQVLFNLLGNAIKFSARERKWAGQVELRMERIGGEGGEVAVAFSVIDNGIGMSPETLANLFKPFTQGESSTTRRFGGTGLGLSICQRLVELMGGRIGVESAPGKGSIFRFELKFVEADVCEVKAPAMPAPRSRVSSPPMTVEQARANGSLILVAEDNEVNRKVIQRQLALLGHVADIVDNGKTALERWRAGRYALLLTDLHMPEMDGYELAARIRAEENGTRIPIVAFTANASKGQPERCVDVGMDDYLTKPVQSRDLKAMLDRWMLAAARADLPREVDQEEMDNPSERLPVLDVRVLAGLVGTDPETISEFLTDYSECLRESGAKLRGALSEGATAVVGAVAHSLKSSSRSVGALALGAICEQLEAAGNAADQDALLALMPAFDQAWAELDSALERVGKG
jgi:PAS domain S-box-containing protein